MDQKGCSGVVRSLKLDIVFKVGLIKLPSEFDLATEEKRESWIVRINDGVAIN